MSIVTVQLGQCGNQVGLSFFQTLMADINNGAPSCSKKENEDYRSKTLERFFYQPDDDVGQEIPGQSAPALAKVPSARAVMVDMESKVIQNTVAAARRSGTWRYPTRQQYCRKRGAGNNWADGFYGHGTAAEERVMEMVQREVERCDRFGGFLSLMSVAGGTGSGVGTRITHCLKDRYPEALLLNQLVWPHDSGEVILQNYNAILSLAHLSECSDAISIVHNDHVRRICANVATGTAANTGGVSFKDMNKLIAENMALLLQPCRDESGKELDLFDLLGSLVAHPDYKLLTLSCVPQTAESSLPFSTFAWPGLIKRLHQMLVTSSVIEEGLNWQIKPGSEHSNKCVGNRLILRGQDSHAADVQLFQNPSLYTDWMPVDSAFSRGHSSRQFAGYEKAACLLSNGQATAAALDAIVRKAWDMFAMRAYVHWYARHGMAEETFIDCFASLEQLLSNYKQL